MVPAISPNGENRQFSAVFQAPNHAGKAILSEECQGQNQKRKSCARWSVLLGLIAASLPLPHDQSADLGLGEPGRSQGRHELTHQHVIRPERTAAGLADVVPAGVVGQEHPPQVIRLPHGPHQVDVPVDFLRSDPVELDPSSRLDRPDVESPIRLRVRMNPDEGRAGKPLPVQDLQGFQGRYAVEMRELIESIDTSHVVGLRDRALIGLMVYSFARVGAAVAMRVEDYYPKSKRWWVRLHEKGGKLHEMPAHHCLEPESCGQAQTPSGDRVSVSRKESA